MSRWAHGTSPAKWCEELGGGDRAGLARLGRVDELGDWPLTSSAYSGCSGSRHTSSPVSRPAVARRARPSRRRWRSGPRRSQPSATTIAAGQRGDVDQPLGALAARVGEAVRSTSRPSASVLLTSIVVPSSAWTMSPGLTARPPTACSRSRRRRPITRTGSLSSAIAADRLDHRGAAATCRTSSPASSAAGLIEIPPVSNVTALPTRPSSGAVRRRPARSRRRISRGALGRALGDRGERAHAPLERISSSSSTVGSDPEPLGGRRAYSASAVGRQVVGRACCRGRAPGSARRR